MYLTGVCRRGRLVRRHIFIDEKEVYGLNTKPVVSPSETSLANGSASTSGTTTADRVADVLFTFISGPASLGVSEVARELKLSKAVVHRIFQSLASRRFLQVDSGTRSYRLGPSATALGARGLRDLDMRRAARPVLEALRDETNETTTLSELLSGSRVYLDQFESPRMIRMTVELGRPHPLHAGGSGKSILAFMTHKQQQRVLSADLERLTSTTITSGVELARDLELIVERGYAISLGERQHDAGSVAAPVFGGDGSVIGALSICGPVGRLTDEAVDRYGALITRAATDVSRRLGWTGNYPVQPSERLGDAP